MITPSSCSSSPRTRTPTRRSGRTDERIVTDRYVLWMGRGDEPGWNVAQRFRLRADELDEVRAEIHEILRERGRTALQLGGRLERDPGRPRRAAARTRARRRRARPARDRDGAHRAARRAPARRRRGAARADAGRAPRRRADRRDRVRRAGTPTPDSAPPLEPDGRQRRLPRLRRRRAGGACLGVVLASTASRSSAARRCPRRAAEAPTGRWWRRAGRTPSPAERRCSSRRRARCRGRSSRRLGFREVCEIRILLDHFDGRPAQSSDARLGESGLCDPGGDGAGGGSPRPGEGRADRAGAGDPGQLPREHPRRPAERRDRDEPAWGGGRLLARARRRRDLPGRRDPRGRRPARQRPRHALRGRRTTRAAPSGCATCGSPCARACGRCSSTSAWGSWRAASCRRMLRRWRRTRTPGPGTRATAAERSESASQGRKRCQTPPVSDTFLGPSDEAVVLDGRERLVEVMQEPAPFLVLG